MYFYSLSNKILLTPIELCFSLLTEILTVQFSSFDFGICWEYKTGHCRKANFLIAKQLDSIMLAMAVLSTLTWKETSQGKRVEHNVTKMPYFCS